ncbi:MAG: PIG-L deacetylase family protein [Candidatus Thorarchaeota archaeon]
MELRIESALILSPHTDDMELGAGATVRKLIGRGVQVKSLVFSDCKKSVPSGFPEDTLRKECQAAAAHLGIQDLTILEFPVREFPKFRQDILQRVIDVRNAMKPDLVIAPWKDDLHQDHSTLGREALRAFMRNQASVWSYQVPGICPGFNPDIYVPLTEEDVTSKIDMLQSYQTQALELKRDYFTAEKIRGFLSYFGTFARIPYAEGFVNNKSVFKSLS